MALALIWSLVLPQAMAADHPRPMDAGTDPILLQRFCAGDELAFATLVREYQTVAHAVAWRITARDDLAADVVQEAFLRVLRHREAFDAAKAFKPWLLQIVRNLAIDALRLTRRHDVATAETGAVTPDPAQGLDAAELRARVAGVLASLPEKYREILVMREMEDLPAEEIARRIGVEYATTRWRLHEARRLFRIAWLARFGPDEATHA
jgi:RNA polymerase sigma-70 factor (ECF subfamily)